MILSVKEKIAYALGDGAANIAWRGVSTFLMIFYTDVFGLAPAVVGWLMLLVRFSDGISDVVMGTICDHTNTRWGKFRPWVLWSAIPLAVILSLMFTCPSSWSMNGKIAYAYITYILFTLIYTANNIPYGSLMAVMTPDDKERTSLGSFRMVGAFAGGMLVQGLLLFLVAYFGNVNPKVEVTTLEPQTKYEVVITTPQDVPNINVTTKNGIAKLVSTDIAVSKTDENGNYVIKGVELDEDGNLKMNEDQPSVSKSFGTIAGKPYHFTLTTQGEDITPESFRIVDQSQGYSKAIYLLSFFLGGLLLVTFWGTRERVEAPKAQKSNLKEDFKNLITNKPWIVLVLVGLLFNIYNSTKQGTTLYYFTHYVHNQLLAAGYMTGLMIASIVGAMITAPISKKIGKKNLFIAALISSGVFNALLYFCQADSIVPIFAVGMLSEMTAAIFPTLFFAMLGDVADYSEYVNNRRATGLVYSAGSFATKFGGGIAGALIAFILGMYGYDGTDALSIQNAVEGIRGLMSWIPALLCAVAAILMIIYPLSQAKTEEITAELGKRRQAEDEQSAVKA